MRISDWSSDVCSSDRRPRQEPLQMNYNDHRPGLKARAAHLAIHMSLALSSAAAVLTLGVSAVTAMPASAAGLASDVAPALKLRLPQTPIEIGSAACRDKRCPSV